MLNLGCCPHSVNARSQQMPSLHPSSPSRIAGSATGTDSTNPTTPEGQTQEGQPRRRAKSLSAIGENPPDTTSSRVNGHKNGARARSAETCKIRRKRKRSVLESEDKAHSNSDAKGKAEAEAALDAPRVAKRRRISESAPPPDVTPSEQKEASESGEVD